MNTHETARFARQVGFGLAPDEDTPQDPVAWAQSQFDRAPPVAFLANRSGALMDNLPANLKLLHTQEEVAIGLQAHHEAEQQSFAAAKDRSREEYARFRYDTVEYPYWNLEPWKEMQVRGAMAVNGAAPVFERFWHFWANHFTVSPTNNNINTAVGPYMRMLRTRMAGSFRAMLFEAVTHPAMVAYLDNDRSTGPQSKARRQRWTTDEINENLGREMLELFTLSPAAAYSQDDVLGATYILTGWGVHRPDKWRKPGVPLGSYFNFDKHEPGTQTVMGKKYSAFVHNDGKLNDLVDDLAAHPATAQHICHKLAVAFIADEPPADSVARLVAVFRQSKGDLPALHKAVVAEVALAGAQVRKFQDPQTWLWSIFRISGTPLQVAPPAKGVPGERYHWLLGDLGQPVHQCPQPNGWSLYSRDWISREMADRRVRYAYDFARRMTDADERLQTVVARQHGAYSAIALALATAARKGLDARARWTAYLTSPDLLWS
jgi:uncharacterized protein (DUF1800 family)